MENYDPPRFEEFGPLLIAGLTEAYTDATNGGIPAQWQRFLSYLGRIPGRVGGVSYGLLFPAGKPDQWDYVCGMAVSHAAQVAPEFEAFDLQKQKYGVFAHNTNLSAFRDTLT